MKIVAIVQARMGSSRLPRKVMRQILGKPMLWHVINRLQSSKLIDEIVIATTDKPRDKPILKLAEGLGVGSYAGSGEDVLDRYYRAAQEYDAAVVVRITADCPLIDPIVTDRVIKHYLESDCDYAANILTRTYPDGLDVEVFSFETLEKAWREARQGYEREHVTPYIGNNPDKFRLANVENNIDLSPLRWTVDTAEDLEFVREVYKRLFKEGEIFHMKDILGLSEKYASGKHQ